MKHVLWTCDRCGKEEAISECEDQLVHEALDVCKEKLHVADLALEIEGSDCGEGLRAERDVAEMKERVNSGRTIFAKTWAPGLDLCPTCAEVLDQLMRAFRESDSTRAWTLMEVAGDENPENLG